MSTNVTSTETVSESLLEAPFQLNIWLGLFIFITGNMSAVGNLLVFSSRTFRSRACSVYLIVESLFNFIYFDFVLVTRITQKGFRVPIINQYESICKIRQFFSEYTHQVAFSLFTLATIDRLLSTQRSMNHRRWSNRVSLAYKMVPAVILFWLLIVGHRLFLYSSSTGTCIPQPGVYGNFDAYFESIMSGVWPPIVLLILGCLLLRNVRHMVHRRVVPAGASGQAHAVNLTYIQQIDSQITTMLLLQSFIAIPSFLPYGAQNFYSCLSQNWYKSPLRLAWESVIIETIRLFSYVFYSTSFYVSFAASRGFRRVAFQILHIRSADDASDSTQNVTQNISTKTTRRN